LEFPLSLADQRAARRALGVDFAAGTYVCVHPGGVSAARWPPESFAAVADALGRTGLQTVLTGTDAERTLAARVAAAMQTRPVDTTGRTGLGALGALLHRARLLICNDTGVSHLAAALRVPSVVIFTTSDPDRWAPLDRRLHRRAGPVRHAGARGPEIAAVVGQAMALLGDSASPNAASV
jgi:ADP-heptose:LPS heptosyltransferase